ncbi:MAG TPA: SDR family oxidoreductase [Planctomycetota bacterium]|nr:SDR family oxidoreductase [Planctomycetota bacterium]
MSFLNLEGKTIVIFGIANKKSVAYHIAETVSKEGAKLVLVVRSEARRENISKLFPKADIYLCDVEFDDQIERVCREIGEKHRAIHGVVHSIAFANYSDGFKPFHETKRKDFLQAVGISCYSLTAIANGLKPFLDKNASIVTISISTTRMAAENYGYMAPVKAALDSSLCFLAKSFSAFSNIRFNAVCPGLLKTSASAGIPGYVDSYLFAERITLRKKAVETQEVANAAAFLLSERSSGINAQGIVIDAGMALNYFDKDVVKRALRPDQK